MKLLKFSPSSPEVLFLSLEKNTNLLADIQIVKINGVI